MDEFRAGVTACLRSWSVLRTVVQNEWGGTTSIEKAEVLRDEIITSMTQKKMVDVTDLEDALAIYMEEEFSIVLDDNSEKQIALTIFRMFEEASTAATNQTINSGTCTFILQIIQMAEQVTKEFGHLPLHVQSSEPMEDDDDDDVDVDDDEHDMNQDDIMDDMTMTNSTGVDTTTATISLSPNMNGVFVVTNLAEYAAKPLFGLSREQRRLQILQKKNGNESPVRQLGETTTAAREPSSAVVDDDGFVSVVVASRRNKPK